MVFSSEFTDLQELHLATWRLLGDLLAGKAFQERLLPPCVQLIDRRCELCTTPSGGPFVAGVLDGKRILFTLLSEQCSVMRHSTILSHIFTLSSCMKNKVDGVLLGRPPLAARWVLGDISQIHLEDLSFLHGIYQWFWWLLLKSCLTLCCPFHTLLLCSTMGTAFAVRQVSGMSVEQEQHAYAVPLFFCFSPEGGSSLRRLAPIL